MLARQGFATAALDAKLLAGHVLGLDALALAVREGEAASPEAVERLAQVMRRRMAGEPVARIIGEKEFYGLAFGLNAATLEPRPDSELLVDLALDVLPEGGYLLDLGTGTGCLPIALLANRPDARGVASDLSAEALDMARANAGRHGLSGRLDFVQGDWFDALAGAPRFDLIVSNPPYIASGVIETLAPDVRDFDPRLALDGGADGLRPYRIIAQQAQRFLKPGGWVLVEIGYDQGEAVQALFAACDFVDIGLHRDMAGLDRVVSAHHMDNNPGGI